jgi:hypothetical protein
VPATESVATDGEVPVRPSFVLAGDEVDEMIDTFHKIKKS